MSTQLMCPRRSEIPATFKLPEHDTWEGPDGFRTCSYCGSLHPDEFMTYAEAGNTLTPSDKNYKTYIEHESGESKFYFKHLSEEQMAKFVELFNAKVFKFHYPGYFYRFPFFMKPVGLGPKADA